MIDGRSIERSLNAHLIWKIRFEFAIGQSLDMEIPSSILSAHDLCPFGKWLHGQTPSADEMSSDDFETVSALHAQCHKLAGSNYSGFCPLFNGQ